MTVSVIFEEVESEIIEDKLLEGYSGLKFLVDIAGDFTERNRTSLISILNFCIGEITNENYLAFTVQAFADSKDVFERKFDVSVDAVRKLLLKIIAEEVNKTVDKKEMVIQSIVEKIEEYKKVGGN